MTKNQYKSMIYEHLNDNIYIYIYIKLENNTNNKVIKDETFR